MSNEHTTSDDTASEDTEGHMPRVRFTEAAGEDDMIEDDSEGHAIRSGRLHTAGEGDLVDDDAEGHRYVPKDERFGGSEPKAMRGKLEQADDTEGHGFRGNVEAADEHDTEGHGFRGP